MVNQMVFQSVKMTIFIFIGELFFRANGLRAGFAMMKRMAPIPSKTMSLLLLIKKEKDII